VQYDNPYSGISDVFVYDAEGRMLTGVRLFDQNGEPVRLGHEWCEDDTRQEKLAPGIYPYCPQNAPFLVPSASPSVSATAPPTPSPAATPPSSVKPSSPSVRSTSAVPPTPSTFR
jgi:hypothetical protein